jgi:hypothetical protein
LAGAIKCVPWTACNEQICPCARATKKSKIHLTEGKFKRRKKQIKRKRKNGEIPLGFPFAGPKSVWRSTELGEEVHRRFKQKNFHPEKTKNK